MGRKAKPIVWLGVRYLSVSWALPDVYEALGPLASDPEVAEELDVDVQRVQTARVRAGIPEYRKRSGVYR